LGRERGHKRSLVVITLLFPGWRRTEDEFENEYEDDWGTIARKEKRANEIQISSKSFALYSKDRFRSSIVIVLELVLVLGFF
jgi:hypothetical protein